LEPHFENLSGHGSALYNTSGEREFSQSAARHAGASKRCGDETPEARENKFCGSEQAKRDKIRLMAGEYEWQSSNLQIGRRIFRGF